jgi:ABC-type lipoprotein release transport system permease subunit
MILLLRLAWRSVWRHRRRSIITGAAISLGLAMMLIFVGIGDDGHARMAQSGVRLGAGHILVQGRGYQEQRTLDSLVPAPEKVISLAREIPSVAQVALRVQTSGLISAGDRSSSVHVSAVDPVVEARVSDFAAPKNRVAGEYLRPFDAATMTNRPAEMYLGQELAKTLEVELGDRVVLTMSPRGKERPVSAAFVVCGVFRTGVSELDGFYVEIALPVGQSLLGLGQAVTQVAILLRRLEDTTYATERLKQSLSVEPRVEVVRQLEVLPWTEALRELHEVIELDDASIYVMMYVIFFIVALGIFNAVLMSVMQRTKQFGVMMALGTSGARLFVLVLTEALILALVFSTLGLAIGLGLHAWVASTGIDLGALTGGDYQAAGVVINERIYSTLGVWTVAKWTLVVMGLVLAAAIYPAYRASKLQPVEAMNHV